jgi:hypothetical protein
VRRDVLIAGTRGRLSYLVVGDAADLPLLSYVQRGLLAGYLCSNALLLFGGVSLEQMSVVVGRVWA